MKKTIIISHPWNKSFNHAIANRIRDLLTSKGENFHLIDLYNDQFDPALGEQDLKRFKDGVAIDPQVVKYQNILKETDELVMVFPIWWYSMPAILKGFIEKAMLKNFSYTETPTGLKGKLTHIKRTTIITTSESPTWYLKFIKGNFIEKVFKKGILRDIGIKNVQWINFPNIKKSSQKMREAFLENLNV